MRVLVTGGSGFIGRALVADLLAAGHRVVILDRHHPQESGAVGREAEVEVVVGDIRDRSAVDAALVPGTDAVVHLAAVTSVLRSVDAPVETFEVNVAATQLLLERSRAVGAERFVMASTNAVAGNVSGRDIDETIAPAPLTPYGATKAAAEMLMSPYGACYGVACCAVRLTNIYGPGMKEKDSFVPRLMRAALDGGGIAFYGDGSQRRDLLYVGDAVAGLTLPLVDPRATGILTVGFGSSISVVELHQQVCAVTGVDIPVHSEPAKAGEMKVVSVDTSRARSLGFRPATTLAEGLAATWDYFRGL